MRTDNPTNDASVYINSLDSRIEFEGERCDLCGEKEEKSKAILAPDGHGFYCRDCFSCGDVESFLNRHGILEGWELTDYLLSNAIKIVKK
jgi:hypothetical protein